MRFMYVPGSSDISEWILREVQDDSTDSPLQVIASSEGIRLEGRSSVLKSELQLREFSKAIGQCWQKHQEMVAKTKVVLPYGQLSH